MASLQADQPTAPTSYLPGDWIPTAWETFAQLVEQSEYQDCKAYYYDGKMRIEEMPVGSDHAADHAALIFLIGIFGMVTGLSLSSRDACSYRKPGTDEFQPDISYHVEANANAIPRGTRLVNLEVYPRPDLVIEVSDTTLQDDKGSKRL